MNQRSGIFLAMLVCALLAVVVFYLFDSSNKVYASPQEVFDASCAAVKKNDAYAWSQCLTDDSRDLIVTKDILFFIPEALEKAKDADEKAMVRALAEVQTKHGLTNEFLAKHQDEYLDMEQKGRGVGLEARLRFARTVLAPVSDVNAFFADMHQVMVKTGANPLAGWADFKLSKVQTSGKTAQGVLVTEHKGKEEAVPIHFRKQGEGWRIDLFAEMSRPPPGPRGFKHP